MRTKEEGIWTIQKKTEAIEKVACFYSSTSEGAMSYMTIEVLASHPDMEIIC